MTRIYTTRTYIQSFISKFQTVWPQFEYQSCKNCAGANKIVQGQKF